MYTMRTMLVIVILFAVCQGHPSRKVSPQLSLEGRLLGLLRNALNKNNESAGMPSNATTPHGIQPNATTPDFNSTHTGPNATTHGFNGTHPEPNYDWIKEEYEGLEEVFLFPGSHYLTDLIDEHCASPLNILMEKDDIQDYLEIPECELKVIRKNILKVSKVIEEPEITALLATRLLLKPIFNERMKCPAAILDTAIVRVIMAQKDEFMKADDESLYNYFKGEIPKIDAVLGDYADDIAFRAVELLHGLLFNETFEFIFGYGLKDVAVSSHRLFHELKGFFEYHEETMYYDINIDLRYRILGALWEVQCPTSMELVNNHQKTVWRFRDVFGAIETEHICSRAVDFLHRYINMTMPGVVVNLEGNGVLWTLCEGIGHVIDGVVQAYTKYESFLFSMNIRELEELMRDFMSDEEWEVLNEAVTRLGFTDIHQSMLP